MKKLELLRAWGCDVDGALARVLDDEAFYLECLAAIPPDAHFERLQEALAHADAATAFDSAHTLKGVLANLGLTPMFQKTVELVEPLRAGHTDHLTEKMEELLTMRDYLTKLLE